MDTVLDNPDLVDQFAADKSLVGIVEENPTLVEALKPAEGSTVDATAAAAEAKVQAELIKELQKLGLQEAELKIILEDIKTGAANLQAPTTLPQDAPATTNLSTEFAGLSILEDRSLSGGTIDPASVTSKTTAFDNSFYVAVENIYLAVSSDYEEVTSSHQDNTTVYEESDTFFDDPANDNFNMVAGRDVTLSSGVYELGNVYGDGNELFVFSAHDNLNVSGSLEFKVSSGSVDRTKSMLGFLSAGSLTISSGTSIKFEGESIGMASAEKLEIINVSLEADTEISIDSLEDLVITNTELKTAGTGMDDIHLKAYNELAIDGLQFSSAVRQIHMEAMTINLRNIYFPAGSDVYLKSLYGPLDGKYPTFGADNQQAGRVNFIHNVQYNQQLLNSRAAFDLHGGNIHILGK
tara:strand:- start:326 stop:1549 length:1224 start_codon:yes stop_codon:yes gene_type:complete